MIQMNMRIVNVLVACSAIWTTGACAADMWTIETQTDQVFRINTSTLTATLVGPAGIDVWFGGLAFNPSGSTLYSWSTTLPTGLSGSLYTVNQSTGAFSLIGGSSTARIATFDIGPVTGEAIALTDAKLQNVNLATGAVSLRAPVSTNLDDNNSAFGLNGTLFNVDGSSLYAVNVNTGQATVVGGTGLSSTLQFKSLGYNFSDGMLYGIPLTRSESFPLYTFNPMNGHGTLVGNVTGLPNVSGKLITAATFAPIPEPSALVLFGSAMLAFALVRARFRASGLR